MKIKNVCEELNNIIEECEKNIKYYSNLISNNNREKDVIFNEALNINNKIKKLEEQNENLFLKLRNKITLIYITILSLIMIIFALIYVFIKVTTILYAIPISLAFTIIINAINNNIFSKHRNLILKFIKNENILNEIKNLEQQLIINNDKMAEYDKENDKYMNIIGKYSFTKLDTENKLRDINNITFEECIQNEEVEESGIKKVLKF